MKSISQSENMQRAEAFCASCERIRAVGDTRMQPMRINEEKGYVYGSGYIGIFGDQ